MNRYEFALDRGYKILDDGSCQNGDGEIINGCRNYKSGKCPYLYFKLKIDGLPTRIYFHKLMAWQKFGEKCLETGIVTRHLNGNPLDNSISNIEIGTQSQNSFDRPVEERRKHAAKQNRIHSDEFIAELRQKHIEGFSYNKLSAMYGLPKSTLSYYLSKSAARTSYSNPLTKTENVGL